MKRQSQFSLPKSLALEQSVEEENLVRNEQLVLLSKGSSGYKWEVSEVRLSRKGQKVDLEKILAKLSDKEREFISILIEKDPLTGVYNRRKFDNDIELLISMSDRTTKGCGLLIIDIDNFKDFNDKFGHFEGDQLLRSVTQNIEQSLRNYDKIHIYRYGGEEFVVIIPDTSANDALAIGERLRKNVKKACEVTISIGISHYKELAGNINELITNADNALYEAKRAGKDRVLLYEKTP